MAKPILIEGKPHRKRRGKLVEIPAEWVGKTVSRQTINKRPSKGLHKHSKLDKSNLHKVAVKNKREGSEETEE